MNTWIGVLTPTSILASIAWLVVTFIGLMQKWVMDRRQRSPFTSVFLRNPGRTLLRQSDDARGDVMVNIQGKQQP